MLNYPVYFFSAAGYSGFFGLLEPIPSWKQFSPQQTPYHSMAGMYDIIFFITDPSANANSIDNSLDFL